MPKLREPNPKVSAFTDTWPAFLREARIEANLSQWVLSVKAGLSAGSVSDWEAGRRVAPIWAQIDLCEALGYPVAALFPRDAREMALAQTHRKRREQSPSFAEAEVNEARRREYAACRFAPDLNDPPIDGMTAA